MLQKLKESVEIKFGRKIVYQKDCKDLSDSIIDTTSMVVSPSTLRRFFGFLSTNSNPSRATLDILAQYSGYKNWEKFKEENILIGSLEEPIMDIWLKAKSIARQISLKNIESIKKQYALDFDNAIDRKFASERISKFLPSQHKAIAFVGPGGCGKTTILAKWYESHLVDNKNSNDIVLFLPASALEAWVGKEMFIEEWISSLLGYKSAALFNSFHSNPKFAPGKFILTLDALDDLSISTAKIEKIYNGLHQLLLSLPSDWFKLIISSRPTSWEVFINQSTSIEDYFFEGDIKKWNQKANIPSLIASEIQTILDSKVNLNKNQRILVEELGPEIFKLITNPYYLQLFIETSLSSTKTLYPSRVELVAEFFKKEISQKQLSEEKLDILSKIVYFLSRDFKQSSIKKNDLKEIYPIHLKLSGNYYAAYDQLVSFGIVVEDMDENEFGVITNRISIAQREVLIYIYMLSIIEQEGTISFDIFKRLETKLKGTELLADSITFLFEMAFKAKKVDVLKKLFKLSDRTIEEVFKQPLIFRTIIRDEGICKELVQAYINEPKGKQYLIDSFVDINSISSSRLLFNLWLQKAESYSDSFKGTILKNIQQSYDMDLNWINNFKYSSPDINELKNISPLIGGLFGACLSIYQFFTTGSNDDNLDCLLNKYQKMFSGNWSYDDNLTFEHALVIGMLFTRNYSLLSKRTGRILKGKSTCDLSSKEKALLLYHEFAKWEETNKFDNRMMLHLEDVSSSAPYWVSHQVYIIEKSWFAMYEFTKGKMENAYRLYRNATEMSSIAGYKIFEMRLLKNLSTTLQAIGEQERAEECDAFVKSFAEKSGIKYELL